MSIIFIYTLVAHVLLGLLGIILFYLVWMGLLKKNLNIAFLKWASLGGLVSFLLSWLSGGYYYVLNYGSAVKPLIKGGAYPWAHSVIMETKEHIFLLLPFLAVITYITILFSGKTLQEDKKTRKALTYITGLIVLIGIAITLGGMAVSGAVPA